MEEREQQLKDLGFEKNEHQQSYNLSKFDCNWYVNFWKVSDYNEERWNILLEDIRYDFEMVTMSDKEVTLVKPIGDFIEGYNFAEKELKQKVKDLYNKYCSQLKEENNPKLTKVINKERVLILSSKIQVLGELRNKM